MLCYLKPPLLWLAPLAPHACQELQRPELSQLKELIRTLPHEEICILQESSFS